MLTRGGQCAKQDAAKGGDTEGNPAKRRRNRQRVRQDFIYRAAPVLGRQTQVTMEHILKIVEILVQQRAVQLVLRQKLLFDMLGKFALPVERAAGHQADQEKRDRDDAKKNDNQTEGSFRDKSQHRLELHQGMNRDVRQLLAAIKKLELNKEEGSGDDTP